MPPFNDIYIVTADRSEACINKFLSDYADLAIDKQRNDFSILIENEDVETGTLGATITYGLFDEHRSFALYFKSTMNELESVILFFTPDSKLVLGLSIEYKADNNKEAKCVLDMLKTEFKTDLGVITVETPPGDAYDWINENSGRF